MPRGQLRASLLDLLRRRHKARRPARGKNGQEVDQHLSVIRQRLREPLETEFAISPLPEASGTASDSENATVLRGLKKLRALVERRRPTGES